MKSEEPYLYLLAFIGANGEGWRVVGPDGPQGNILGSENAAIETVRFLNIAYANGRKSRDVLRHGIERMMSSVGEEDFEILSEVIRADDGWNNCGQSME